MAEASAEYQERLKVARCIGQKIYAGMAQRALEQDNLWRSMHDRIDRGLSPFGAASSRYEPTEEADEP